MSKRIAIVGPGTIGTILHRLLQTDNDVTFIGRDNFPTTNWADFEVIFFAVKPQVFKTFAPLPASEALIISVMAGITTSTLKQITSSAKIIRTMPNTALQVNMGMTVWCKTASVVASEVDWFTQALQKATALLEVADDEAINKATAVSASGPGFIFATIEAFILAAQHIGLSTAEANLLVTKTFIGSAELLKQSPLSAAELRQQVTSQGGTTAAGLAQLDDDMWKNIVQAAYNRAKELAL